MESLGEKERKVLTTFFTSGKGDMDMVEIAELCGLPVRSVSITCVRLVKKNLLSKHKVKGREYTIYHITETGRLAGASREEEIV